MVHFCWLHLQNSSRHDGLVSRLTISLCTRGVRRGEVFVWRGGYWGVSTSGRRAGAKSWDWRNMGFYPTKGLRLRGGMAGHSEFSSGSCPMCEPYCSGRHKPGSFPISRHWNDVTRGLYCIVVLIWRQPRSVLTAAVGAACLSWWGNADTLDNSLAYWLLSTLLVRKLLRCAWFIGLYDPDQATPRWQARAPRQLQASTGSQCWVGVPEPPRTASRWKLASLVIASTMMSRTVLKTMFWDPSTHNYVKFDTFCGENVTKAWILREWNDISGVTRHPARHDREADIRRMLPRGTPQRHASSYRRIIVLQWVAETC